MEVRVGKIQFSYQWNFCSYSHSKNNPNTIMNGKFQSSKHGLSVWLQWWIITLMLNFPVVFVFVTECFHHSFSTSFSNQFDSYANVILAQHESLPSQPSYIQTQGKKDYNLNTFGSFIQRKFFLQNFIYRPGIMYSLSFLHCQQDQTKIPN